VTRGHALDLEAFFAQQTAELEIPDPATLTVDPAALVWADREPELAFTSRDTVIGLIPARHGWEVPGRLSWGGAVNYDLDGAHHVAVLRSWQQRYGAELVTLTRDQIELLVAHPPRDPATIVQVAVEMLGYCPDLDGRAPASSRCWPTRSSHTGAGHCWSAAVVGCTRRPAELEAGVYARVLHLSVRPVVV
jgi:Domain of unknown function (DUF4253)